LRARPRRAPGEDAAGHAGGARDDAAPERRGGSMNAQTIGTCSLCGGAVTLPHVWHSVVPPVPTCSTCGATAARHGPVIPMQPPAPAQPAFPMPMPGITYDVGTPGVGTVRWLDPTT